MMTNKNGNSVRSTKVYSTREGRISAKTKRYQKPVQKSVEEDPTKNANRYNEIIVNK